MVINEAWIKMWQEYSTKLKAADVETSSSCSLYVGKEKWFKLQQEWFVLATQETFLRVRRVKP